MSAAGATEATKPAAVRLLRGAAVTALVAGTIAFGIGAILRFDELAKIWGVVGGLLLAIAATAYAGARPSRAGVLWGMVACLLMLFVVGPGTLATVIIAIVASQSWPQLRRYYGLERRDA